MFGSMKKSIIFDISNNNQTNQKTLSHEQESKTTSRISINCY